MYCTVRKRRKAANPQAYQNWSTQANQILHIMFWRYSKQLSGRDIDKTDYTMLLRSFVFVAKTQFFRRGDVMAA